MKISKDTLKTLLGKGIPLLVSMCAGGVANRAMKEFLPVPEKTVEKVMDKIGRYGLQLVVSNAVYAAIEDEVEPVVTTVLDIVCGPDDVVGPTKVKLSSDEIKDNLEKGYKMTYDPSTDEVTFEEAKA